ncbi:MAG: hypothetical protein E6L00_01740 [Thaumarchaeota archaeon]|nr:MAG: hypothetical protein E6L00_01740 [Nitrososphaerota archaeon]
MTRYTAATATNIITKLKENGNSGIDTGGVTVNEMDANEPGQLFGLSVTLIVVGPSDTGGI